MKKVWIITGALLLGTMGLFTGGAVAVHAAEAPAAAVLGTSPGPLRLFFSGQLGRLLTLRSELNLTGEQKQQIHDVVLSHRVEIANALKPVVEKRRALRDAVCAASPDEKAIRAAANDMAQSIGDAAVLASKVRGEIRPILTPEQQQLIDDFRKQTGEKVDKLLDGMANPA